jgi:hypothetical protein
VNQEQTLSALRGILVFVGGILATKGVSAGDWNTISNGVITMVGAGMTIIWGQFAHTDEAKVRAASALPQVKAMTLNDPALATVAKQADTTTLVTLSPKP